MLRSGLLLAISSMMLLPTMASATVYTFQATETSALSPSPVDFSFVLNTATAVGNASGTTFNDVAIDENGTVTTGNSVGASFTTDLSSPLFFWIDTSVPLVPFYSGSGTGLTFNTGTFAIADGLTDGEGTLTLSGGPASPTPEPESWVLLCTGGAMALAAGRFSRSRTVSSQTAA